MCAGRAQVRNIVDASAIRDIQDSSAYSGRPPSAPSGSVLPPHADCAACLHALPCPPAHVAACRAPRPRSHSVRARRRPALLPTRAWKRAMRGGGRPMRPARLWSPVARARSARVSATARRAAAHRAPAWAARRCGGRGLAFILCDRRPRCLTSPSHVKRLACPARARAACAAFSPSARAVRWSAWRWRCGRPWSLPPSDGGRRPQSQDMPAAAELWCKVASDCGG